jgi:hypothetical protein
MDEGKLENLFSSSVHPENSALINMIREFAVFRVNDIRDELDSLAGTSNEKWILDLTNTALFTLLADWGEQYDEVTAICDPSKPLSSQNTIFNCMIGRKDRIYSEFTGESHPITFNLSGPILFADSRVTHGIQIADAVAAAAVYAFSGEKDGCTEKWREIISKVINHGSVYPELDVIDSNNRNVRRNVYILIELHSRAKAGASLTDGMGSFINLITQHLMTHPVPARRG